MRTHVTLIAALIVALSSAGCREAASASASSKQTTRPGRIVVTGSSTIAPLLNEIGRRFEQRNPGIRVDVHAGGSARGLADVQRGLADLGMVSRDPTAEESALDWFPIARDGVGIIVHLDNSIASITRSQLVSVFTGEVASFDELGGIAGPITVVNKAEGRSTLEVFLDFIELPGSAIDADVVIGDNQQGIKTVAADPRAIGYVSIGAAAHAVSQGESIRLLTVDGVEPTVASVLIGDYPIDRTLNIVAARTPAGLLQRFVAFAQSSQVHDLIEDQFLVPVSVAPTS